MFTLLRADRAPKAQVVPTGSKVTWDHGLYGKWSGIVLQYCDGGRFSPDYRVVITSPGRNAAIVHHSFLFARNWEITGTASPADIADAIALAEHMEEVHKREAEEKAKAQAIERDALTAKYSYLMTQAANPKTTSHALGAANIRTELKRAFPGVRFSVRSRSFAGGDDINIGWTDGPTLKEVKAITGKYEEGAFDGMEDIYNYNHDNQFPGLFGGAKYVFENRSISDALADSIAPKYGLRRVEDGGFYGRTWLDANGEVDRDGEHKVRRAAEGED
jgi:hypothetical protein